MGIYIFKSKHIKAYKLGHFKGFDAWGRVAFRGFYSCKVPCEIQNQVNAEDLILIRWYPNLNPEDEEMIHELFRVISLVGEWYSDIDEILQFCDFLDIDKSNECSLEYCIAFNDNCRLR